MSLEILSSSSLHNSKVLLIEDDVKLAKKMIRFLELNLLKVKWLTGGSFIDLEANINVYDFIICDIDLPDTTGFEIISNIRNKFRGIFIFVTAMTQPEQQIKGLELGSDDYIVKPFVAEVLLARMQAATRRVDRDDDFKSISSSKQPVKVELKGLKVIPKEKKVVINNRELKLTPKELSILFLLVQEVDHTVSRRMIHKVVLNKEYDGFDRTIDVHVSALRKKFNSVKNNRYVINSVWGEGYILQSVT